MFKNVPIEEIHPPPSFYAANKIFMSFIKMLLIRSSVYLYEQPIPSNNIIINKTFSSVPSLLPHNSESHPTIYCIERTFKYQKHKTYQETSHDLIKNLLKFLGADNENQNKLPFNQRPLYYFQNLELKHSKTNNNK